MLNRLPVFVTVTTLVQVMPSPENTSCWPATPTNEPLIYSRSDRNNCSGSPPIFSQVNPFDEVRNSPSNREATNRPLPAAIPPIGTVLLTTSSQFWRSVDAKILPTP